MPQLDISTFLPQLFWLFVSFGLLYILLSKLCIPQLNRVFEERDLNISNNLKAAHQAKDEAAKLKAEYESILSKATTAKTEMFDKEAKKLAKIIDEKMAKFDQELIALVQESEKKMQAFEVKMEADIVKIAKEATLSILDNIAGVKPSEKAVMQAIKEAKEVSNAI